MKQIEKKELDEILNSLGTLEAKLEFLESIYQPGNILVADKIMELNPNESTVLGKETAYAKNHNNEERFQLLVPRLIDIYIEQDWIILIAEEVQEWGDEKIIKDLILKLFAKDSINSLDAVVNISKNLGYAVELHGAYIRLLQLKSVPGYGYPTSKCTELVALERYKEAIDIYVTEAKKQECYYQHAMDLAKKHCPGRIKEIAKKAFNEKLLENGWVLFYLECAKTLNLSIKAKSEIIKKTRTMKITSSPRFYEDWIAALQELSLNKEAEELGEKVIGYATNIDNYQNHFTENIKELATFYKTMNRNNDVEETCIKLIKQGISEKHHISNVIDYIDFAIKLTGKQEFISYKFDAYNEFRAYEEAKKLAEELKDEKRIALYSSIIELLPKKSINC